MRVQRHHQQGGEEQRVARRAEKYALLLGSWTGDALVRSHPLRIPPGATSGGRREGTDCFGRFDGSSLTFSLLRSSVPLPRPRSCHVGTARHVRTD